VSRSAVFEARRISVAGNRHLSDRQVLAAAGVGGATNVLWFSPGRVESRLEGNPWIQSAQVSRSLPSTVSISILERVPAATVLAGDRRSLIASDGTVLGAVDRAGRLPEIQTPPGSPSVVARQIRTALRALEAVPRGVRGQVRQAGFRADGGLVLELRGGVRALYGDSTQLPEKGQALAAILGWAKRHGMALTYVDVRAPVTPAARPVAPATPTPPVTLAPAGSPGTRQIPSPGPSLGNASPSPTR
jgi:cell division protein FtsQ